MITCLNDVLNKTKYENIKKSYKAFNRLTVVNIY